MSQVTDGRKRAAAVTFLNNSFPGLNLLVSRWHAALLLHHDLAKNASDHDYDDSSTESLHL